MRGVAKLPSRRATIKVDLSSRRMSGSPEGPGGMYGPRRRPMVIPQAAQDVVKAAHDHLDAISGIGFQTAPDGKTGVGGCHACSDMLCHLHHEFCKTLASVP